MCEKVGFSLCKKSTSAPNFATLSLLRCSYLVKLGMEFQAMVKDEVVVEGCGDKVEGVAAEEDDHGEGT